MIGPYQNSGRMSPLLLAATLCIATGCGRDPNIPDLAPAYGVVTFNGEPLSDATVQFASNAKEKGYFAGIGSTNSQGKFRIRTYNLDGAVIGSHKVVIIRLDESSFVIDPKTKKPVPKIDARWKKPKSLIPVKYTHLDKSGLTAEVKADGKNRFVFELKDE